MRRDRKHLRYFPVTFVSKYRSFRLQTARRDEDTIRVGTARPMAEALGRSFFDISGLAT